MLTFLGQRQTFCDGLHRRNFLKLGAFGAGLTLADQLRLSAHAAPAGSSAKPMKSAIMIYLPGGPSHIDTYDLKPDAPAEFRGEFKPIKTNVPGIDLCEYFPMQAKMMDKLSVVRSLVANDEHSDSYVMTGYTEQTNRAAVQGQHPSFGAVMSRLRNGQSDIPPFDTVRRDVDKGTTMAGLDAFTGRAFDMISSGQVHRALDLKNEDPRTRDRYKNVEQFLQARRLIEAGVGCVTLSYGGWDTHSSNFKTLKKQLPELDRGIANLIQDLHDRGMQDDVVLVVWGEFGRTPKINGSDAGRDHWSPVMSAMVAGGGLKMGQAIGASSAKGEYPKDRPYKVPHLLSTIYGAMGIDAGYTFPNGAGRPMYILDDRNKVEELI